MPDDADSFALDTEPPNKKPILDPPVIQVYLACALTNLDEDAKRESEACRLIIREILHEYDYFGIRFYVYDPGDVTPPGSIHTAEEVYITDHQRTSNSDLILFYVTWTYP